MNWRLNSHTLFMAVAAVTLLLEPFSSCFIVDSSVPTSSSVRPGMQTPLTGSSLNRELEYDQDMIKIRELGYDQDPGSIWIIL